MVGKEGRVDCRDLAAEYGRKLTYGLRIHVITRDTADEAWAVADRLLAGIDPADIERMQANLRRSESEGSDEWPELHRGGTDSLEIAPNLWAASGWYVAAGNRAGGVPRGGGGPDRRILGVGDRSLHPVRLSHLEEAYWFGEGKLPILEQGLWEAGLRCQARKSVGGGQNRWAV